MVRVLLVDDSRGLRVLVRTFLEDAEGFEIIGEAEDGEEGVAQAKALQPDLVLLDLSMPRMDGLEALPLIRDAAPEAVVVIYSAFQEQTAAKTCLKLGARAYIDKSVDPEEMVECLRELAATELKRAPPEKPPKGGAELSAKEAGKHVGTDGAARTQTSGKVPAKPRKRSPKTGAWPGQGRAGPDVAPGAC